MTEPDHELVTVLRENPRPGMPAPLIQRPAVQEAAPQLRRSPYPRPVRDVHQIEISSRCNLRCHYCPHYPELPRAKEDMTWDTFEAALDHVRFFVRENTQTELSLTGIGEAMLHPDFVAMATKAREAIGPHRQLTITTNGLLLDETMAAAIAPLKPAVFISLHRPEKAAFAVAVARKYGILAGTNESFATSAFDWAGTQTNWTPLVSAPRIKCEYLRSGWCVILVDGRVTTCCLDPDGRGVFGHVRDAPGTWMMAPHGLCTTCHMTPP